MRADRAYIAGFGTTGLLVGSALLLFVVVGAFIGFKWNGFDVADGLRSLKLNGPERRLEVQGPARIAVQAAPAAGAVAETPAVGSAAAAALSAETAPEPRARRVAAVPTPPRPVFQDDSRPQGVSDPSADRLSDDRRFLIPPTSVEPQRVTSDLGESTRGLTGELGETVGGVSPPVGDTLTDTGRLLADLLRALTPPKGPSG